MDKRYEIRAIGYGGQGVISLSKMITKAMVKQENKYAVQTEAYSASARGGKCWADVVVDIDEDSRMIDYPMALSPYDFVFILSNEATSEVTRKDVKEGGWVVWDSSVIPSLKLAKKVQSLDMPFQEVAVRKFGDLIYSSSILFGVFAGLSGILSKGAAIKTLEESVPAKTLDANREAFELGYEAAERARATKKS